MTRKRSTVLSSAAAAAALLAVGAAAESTQTGVLGGGDPAGLPKPPTETPPVGDATVGAGTGELSAEDQQAQADADKGPDLGAKLPVAATQPAVPERREAKVGDAVLYWPGSWHTTDVQPRAASITVVWGQTCVNLDNGASSVTRVTGTPEDAYGSRWAYADEVNADEVTTRVTEMALDKAHERAINGGNPVLRLEDAHKLPLCLQGEGTPVGAASDKAITCFMQNDLQYEVVHVRGYGLARRRT